MDIDINKILKLVLKDYNNGILYREDSVKTSFYYHLRKDLEENKYNKYLYTELNLIDSIYKIDYKADIAISSESKNNNNKNIPIEEIYEIKFTESSLKGPIEKDIKKFDELYKKDKSTKLNFFMIYESKREIKKVQNSIITIFKKEKDKYNIYFLLVKLNENKEVENKKIKLCKYKNGEFENI